MSLKLDQQPYQSEGLKIESNTLIFDKSVPANH